MEIQTMATASQVAKAIQNGQLTSFDLVTELLVTIQKRNPALNAIVTLDAQGALRQARAADEMQQHGEPMGPLQGVPVTIKDSFETVGMRTVSGFPPFANHIPAADAPPVGACAKPGRLSWARPICPPWPAASRPTTGAYAACCN